MLDLAVNRIKQHWASALWFILLLGFLCNLLYLLWPSPPASIVLHSSPATSDTFVPNEAGELSGEDLAIIGNTSTTHRTKHVAPSHKKTLQKVHINTASVQDLQHLPGVGAKMASRIVAYRKQIGKLSSIEQLSNVSGIGEKKLAKMTPYCVID